MKRPLSFNRDLLLVVWGTALIATTYGVVRLAYGLYLPDIQASTGLSSGAAGVVSSAASGAYCVGALLGMAGLGARALVGAAWLTAAAGSLGMALAPDATLLAPAAVLASAGAGLASPGMVALVDRHLPAVRRVRAQAVVNSGTGPGLVGAGVMALVLLPEWRVAFGLGAVLAAVSGLAVLRLDRGHPADDDAAPAADEGIAWRGLARPAGAALVLGAASAAVWTYGRSHLVASGLDGAGSVLAWIAVGLGGTATVLTARGLAELRAPRAWAVTAAGVALATGVLGVAATLTPVAVLACLLFGWAFVAATSALIAWAGTAAPSEAGRGTALLFVLLVLGQAVGALLVAAVTGAAGSTTGFLAAAALGLVAAAFGLGRLRPRGAGAAARSEVDDGVGRAGPAVSPRRPGSGPRPSTPAGAAPG